MTTFSIITATYKRSEKLRRMVDSVLSQSYKDFELIIVNDSPDDVSYGAVEEYLNTVNDGRIRYVKNERNSGANFSRNRALDLVSQRSQWIIFLDDDDFFTTDTLLNFSRLIVEHPTERWFMSDRALVDGKTLTSIVGDNASHEYAWNFLILRRFSGDATHCISRETVGHIRFPKKILQGEEWMFFYQISLRTKFYYNHITTTLSDGYDPSGLNYRNRSTSEQLKNLRYMAEEGVQEGISFYPSFIIYLLIRFVRAWVRTG